MLTSRIELSYKAGLDRKGKKFLQVEKSKTQSNTI